MRFAVGEATAETHQTRAEDEEKKILPCRRQLSDDDKLAPDIPYYFYRSRTLPNTRPLG
jgi:hypothetical protein